jgi:putative glutamine amidotransferase
MLRPYQTGRRNNDQRLGYPVNLTRDRGSRGTDGRPRPKIGITLAPGETHLEFAVVPIQSTATGFVHAVWEAGGLPLLIPTAAIPTEAAGALVDLLDGLILTGGGDVDPASYGEPRHELSTRIVAERDAHEMELTRHAFASGKPVLAICRGMQILNVTLGGSLFQDLITAGCDDHRLTEPARRSHEVTIVPDSLLASAVGATSMRVNSLHHQAVNRLGQHLQPVALAPDGTVEAIEFAGPGWALGVQWHPEWMYQEDSKQLGLFKAVVQQAQETTAMPAKR